MNAIFNANHSFKNKTLGFNPVHKYQHQKGAVLIIGLLILLGITQIALTGINGSLIQERIAKNSSDSLEAFNLSENIINYAIGQDDWVNSAVGSIPGDNIDNWQTYSNFSATFSSNFPSHINPSAKVSATRNHLLGVSVGNNASANLIQLKVVGVTSNQADNTQAGNMQIWSRIGAK